MYHTTAGLQHSAALVLPPPSELPSKLVNIRTTFLTLTIPNMVCVQECACVCVCVCVHACVQSCVHACVCMYIAYVCVVCVPAKRHVLPLNMEDGALYTFSSSLPLLYKQTIIIQTNKQNKKRMQYKETHTCPDMTAWVNLAGKRQDSPNMDPVSTAVKPVNMIHTHKLIHTCQPIQFPHIGYVFFSVLGGVRPYWEKDTGKQNFYG